VSVLLDEWTVRSAVDDGSASWVANDALRTFEDTILRRRGLPPVRFVAEDEYALLLELVSRGRFSRIKQNLLRLLPHFVRTDALTVPAAELPDGPPDLSDSWLRALGAAIDAAPDAWRAPQIIYPSARRADWPQGDDIAGRSAGGGFRRPLVPLERYEEHPHACADWDPWDQRHLHRPTPGRDEGKPRLLPRPPELREVLLRDLAPALDVARRSPRQRGEGGARRWCYVPAAGWDPAALGCEKWRLGAFPRGNLNRRGGYLDVDDRVWHWDGNERHWDVQLDDCGDYRRVSHDGSLLD
jgi:hypothetical protein